MVARPPPVNCLRVCGHPRRFTSALAEILCVIAGPSCQVGDQEGWSIRFLLSRSNMPDALGPARAAGRPGLALAPRGVLHRPLQHPARHARQAASRVPKRPNSLVWLEWAITRRPSARPLRLVGLFLSLCLIFAVDA